MSLFYMEFGDKEISYHCLPPPHPLIVLQQEYSVSGIYGGKKGCNFEENTVTLDLLLLFDLYVQRTLEEICTK